MPPKNASIKDKYSRTQILIPMIAILLSLSCLAGAAETKAERDARMKWFRDARFGMYPSELTDWCINSTPFKRDPLKDGKLFVPLADKPGKVALLIAPDQALQSISNDIGGKY